jgi:hypothetical protein
MPFVENSRILVTMKGATYNQNRLLVYLSSLLLSCKKLSLRSREKFEFLLGPVEKPLY